MSRPAKGAIRRVIERGAARAVAAGVRGLARVAPLSWCRAFGAAMAPPFRLISRRRQRLADENLVRCFGERFSPEERKAILRGVADNTCKLFPEMFKAPLLGREALKRIAPLENADAMRRALERGRGAIIVTGHYGNWEILAARLVAEGFDLAVIARDASDAGTASIINRTRNDMGVRVLGIDDTRGMLRHLRANGVLGILPDQHAADGAVRLTFLGRPAWCAKGPATFALRTGCAIVPGFCVREQGDLLRCTLREEIPPPDEPDRETATNRYTQAVMDAIGEAISERPEQWLWTHNRWKERAGAGDGSPRVDGGGT